MATFEADNYYKLIKKLIQAQKPEALRALLNDLNAVEVANSLLQLKLKHQLAVMEVLSKEQASEVIAHMQQHSPILEELLGQMPEQRLGEIIDEMDRDDAADVVSYLEESKADKVLDTMPDEGRQEITSLMQYDEESAGGLMDPEFVAAKQDQTVAQAIQQIRAYVKAHEVRVFYTVYVIDEYGHLIGTVPLTKMLLAEPQELIHDLMNPDVIAVNVDEDQERVARLAKEYGLVVIPVIDKHLRLIGRITIDDVVDVIYKEHEEDMAQIAGTGSEEVLDSSVLRTSRDRLPWLILALGGGMLAAWVMTHFEKDLSGLPQVTYFMPLIAALGGNIAIQSSSIVVRGLATGEIRPADLFGRLWKELRVGLINGSLCSLILFGLAWVMMGTWELGAMAALALFVVVIFATMTGAVIPILLKRMHIDPAIATGPFITSSNDLVSIAIYFSLAFGIWRLAS